MERVIIRSTQIRSVGFSEKEEILEIEFVNGKIYKYFGFSAVKFKEFMNSRSKGQYFSQYILNKYRFEKVG